MHLLPKKQPEQRIEMPRVTDLNLEFDSCYGAPLKMFFTAVHFPQVTTLGLHIVSQEGELEHGMRYGDIFSAVLPNSEEFPKLTRRDPSRPNSRLHNKERCGHCTRQNVIPFSKMPNLRDLVFTMLESEVDLIPLGIDSAQHLNARIARLLANPKMLARPFPEADGGSGRPRFAARCLSTEGAIY